MNILRYAATVVASLLAIGCDTAENTAPEGEAPTTIAPDMLTGTVLAFQQLSAGVWPASASTCGITSTGKLYCWGSAGPYGDGTGSTRPVAVATGLRFRWVSGGRSRGCAIATDYRAYCWSPPDPSQSLTPSPPKLVPGGLLWRQISVGMYYHICGLTTLNKVYCWGTGLWGQLGTGFEGYNGSDVPVEIAGGRSYRSVSAGFLHSCAVTQTYRAYCWGEGNLGRLGAGYNTKRSYVPVLVLGGLQFRQVSAGNQNTCGTTINTNKAYCWGDGRFGQNGNGQTYNKWEPVAVGGGLSIDRVTVSGDHACGETASNKAYCWGQGGGLGDGTTSIRFKPVLVNGGMLFSQLTAGEDYTCGIAAGKGYCWGDNGGGQLGDGTMTDRLTPVPVEGAL